MNEEKRKKSEADELIRCYKNKMDYVKRKTPKKTNIKKIELGSVANEILNDEECEHLDHVCDNSEHPLENNFIVQTMKVIGFRIGEAAHLKKNWVDFEKQAITIPSHEPCDCSYCRDRLKEQLKRMGMSKEEQISISEQEVMKYYWQPKTSAGVRVVYYGFDFRYCNILKNFFSKNDEWPYSCSTAHKRIRKLLDLAGLKDHVPHHLRKTAASNYAAVGFTEQQLMDVMGWDDSKVARKYVRLYGPRSLEYQKKIMGEGKKKGIISDSRITFYLTKFGRKAFTRKKSRDEEEWLRKVLFHKEDTGPGHQISLYD